MKQLDASQLTACGVAPAQALMFAQPLSATFAHFAIDTKLQRAAFIANAMHESGGLKKLAESTYYSKPEFISNAFKRLRPLGLPKLTEYCKAPEKLANLAYARINGNGDEASGDGWAYRGGGIFQNTGREMYRLTGKALGVDLEANPDRLRTDPELACLAAGLFWSDNHLAALADADRFDDVCSVINTGRPGNKANGLDERRTLYKRALPVFA